MSLNHAQRITAAATALDAATAAFLAFLNGLPENAPSSRSRRLDAGRTRRPPCADERGVSQRREGWRRLQRPRRAIRRHVGFRRHDLEHGCAASSDGAADPDPAGRRGRGRKTRSCASPPRLRPAIATLDPALALYCVRLPWAAVSVYQMCEWASGHTVRHIVQVNRELQIAAMNGVAV